MLNTSSEASRFIRSPRGIFLLMRMSLKTVQGVIPALRPRLPSSESSVPLKFAPQGSWRIPVGEYFELTLAPQAGFANVFGREVNDDSCKLSPVPVMILKGRPELNSINGANVQSLSSLPAKPSLPMILPVLYTPLKTNRCR